MIYFIESSAANFNEDGEIINHFSLYKIGYATDEKWKGRETTYKTENPTRYVHRVIDGATLEDERALHSYLNEKFDRFENGKEWYIKSKDLYNYMMNLTLEDIQDLPRSVGNPTKNLYYKVLKDLPKFFIDSDDIKNSDLSFSKFKSNFFDDIISSLGKDLLIEEKLNKHLITKFGEDKVRKYLSREETFNGVLKGLSEKSRFEFLECLEIFSNSSDFYTQMKCLCDSEESVTNQLLLEIGDSSEVVSCFKTLGRDRCRALGYNKTDINNKLRYNAATRSDKIDGLSLIFKEGNKYSVKFVKEQLLDYYNSIGLSVKRINADDLEKYFEIENTTLTTIDPTGKKKRSRAYKIIKKL